MGNIGRNDEIIRLTNNHLCLYARERNNGNNLFILKRIIFSILLTINFSIVNPDLIFLCHILTYTFYLKYSVWRFRIWRCFLRLTEETSATLHFLENKSLLLNICLIKISHASETATHRIRYPFMKAYWNFLSNLTEFQDLITVSQLI